MQIDMKSYYLILVAFILIGCKAKSLRGTFYKLANKEKEISLDFISDTTCLVRQNYLCNKLPATYKNIEIECIYKIGKEKVEGLDENFKKKVKKVDVIYIKNKKCFIIDCKGFSNYTYIPDYDTLCNQLIDRKTINSKINTAVILNLINDTLQFEKNHVIFGYDAIPKL